MKGDYYKFILSNNNSTLFIWLLNGILCVKSERYIADDVNKEFSFELY